jgi:D-alanine transaminase
MDFIVYLNGNFLPQSQAMVSVTDRGFLMGDAVFEVLLVLQQMPIMLQQHLHRLQHSLDEIGLAVAVNTDATCDNILALIAQQPATLRQSLYIQISRGCVGQRSYAAPAEVEPTIFMRCQPLADDANHSGIAAVLVNDIRWQRCDIKVTSQMANVLMLQQAQAQGAEDAILLHNDEVVEGLSSNIFMVKDNVIMTPHLQSNILPGLTRKLVLSLAAVDHKVAEASLNSNQLYEADEVFLSSSCRQIMPVLSIDQHPIGHGKIGPVTAKLMQRYSQHLNDLAGGGA